MKIVTRFLKRIFSRDEIAAMPERVATTNGSPLEETLNHAKTGYQNAQDVIKFVDTKTAFITGLSTVLGGFLLIVLKWSVELDGASQPNLWQVTSAHRCIAAGFYFLVATSLGSAVVCLCSAVWSVIARARPRHLENAFTILFPSYTRRDSANACRVFEQKLRGMSSVEIIKEYEDQLRIVGMILGRKLKHIRISCVALVVQIVSLTFALLLLAIIYYVHWPLLGRGHSVLAMLFLCSSYSQ
jgi:hypothetical protein